MLDVQLIRSDLDAVAARLATRGITIDVAEIRGLEEQRKKLQVRTQDLQANRNTTSTQIGVFKRKGEDTSSLMAQVSALGDDLRKCEADLDSRVRLGQVTVTQPTIAGLWAATVDLFSTSGIEVVRLLIEEVEHHVTDADRPGVPGERVVFAEAVLLQP